VNFEFVSKSFSSLTQGYTIFTFAIAAGGGEAERHLLQTGHNAQIATASDSLHISAFETARKISGRKR
jgi:hypothetical protein